MIGQLQAFALGVVQGLAEFLPISSSAHLVIVPWLFRWKDPGLAFDVALHLGTLLALLIFYAPQWFALAASPFNGDRANRRLLGLLIVASVPGAIFGLLFEKEAETIFRDPRLIAVMLALLGVALWYFDKVRPQKRKIDKIRLTDAVLIGLSQACAVVPGVSRSGSTITMARLLGIDRQDAANFSFMMAAPIIAGAGMVEIPELRHNGFGPAVWIGFAGAAIFGLIAIAGLVTFVRTRSYRVFAWYRFGLAALVFLVFALR